MATGCATSCGPGLWSPSWTPTLVNILFIIHGLYDCSICSERKILPTLLISTLIHTCEHPHRHTDKHRSLDINPSLCICVEYMWSALLDTITTHWHMAQQHVSDTIYAPLRFFFPIQINAHTHTNTPPDPMGDFIKSCFGLCVCVRVACWSLPPPWAFIRWMIESDTEGCTGNIETARGANKKNDCKSVLF